MNFSRHYRGAFDPNTIIWNLEQLGMGGWCSKRNVPTKGTACIQYSQQSSYFSAGCLVSETEYLAQIYGLYSPVSLSSYLFPSVKMGTYIMVSMVVSLIAAVLLVPTAYVLLGARSSGAKAVVSLGKLFSRI